MFTLQAPGWQIVVRTVVVYLAVYVGLRFMGKRELGQMTVFDLVVILLIANAVQNAMVGPDVSVAGGVLAAFVLLAVNRGMSTLRLRGEFWGRLLEGTPTVLIEDGEFCRAAPTQRGGGAVRAGDGDARAWCRGREGGQAGRPGRGITGRCGNREKAV